jgi:hypothetical protein
MITSVVSRAEEPGWQCLAVGSVIEIPPKSKGERGILLARAPRPVVG